MEHSVDDVIGKLSEIEAAAERIMESASEEMRKLSDAMEEKTKQFDEMLLEETEIALKLTAQKLDKEKEEELKVQREETNSLLLAMQQKYDNEHDAWSDRIMQSIVRM